MAERKPVVLVSGQLRELPAGDTVAGAGGDMLDAFSVTYNPDGSINTLTEDGAVKTFAYNGDGTIDTVSWDIGLLTRTETYSYTDGVLTGMTAVEA